MMLNDLLIGKDLVLVSLSPRRRELLKGLDIDFTATKVDTDETYPLNLNKEDVALYIAKEKAAAYKSQLQDNTVAITADTVVLLNGEILGKPKNEEEAIAMLKNLSGNTHTVVTGVCIFSKAKERSFKAITEVTFASLSPEEINYYIQKYRPFDKAGSYGVQEWIGYISIEQMTGSYYNVMGLPTHKLYNELQLFLR